jgi:hypothetical protein
MQCCEFDRISKLTRSLTVTSHRELKRSGGVKHPQFLRSSIEHGDPTIRKALCVFHLIKLIRTISARFPDAQPGFA